MTHLSGGTFRSYWVLVPAIVGAMVRAMPPAAAASSDTVVETIVVTGTRVEDDNPALIQPLTTIDADEIARSDAVSLEQVLARTPAVDFTGGSTAASNNGGAGASLAGIRNLSPQRTVVLVNGYRYPFVDDLGVDLNTIPVPLIDHIEVLRDSASAVYGADAIGGVLNIVTKDRAEGGEIGGSFGASSYGDAVRSSEYSTVGWNWEGGGVLLNIDHDHQAPLVTTERGWAIDEHPEAGLNGDAFSSLSGSTAGATATIGGAQWYFPSGLRSGVPAGQASGLGALQLGQGVVTGGGLARGDVAAPGCCVLFDFLPYEGLVDGFDRTQAALIAHQALATGLTATFEGFYAHRRSHEMLAPEPFADTTPTGRFPNGFYSPALLPDGAPNPQNPTNQPDAQALYGVEQQDVPISNRRFEGGLRLYTDDTDTYRLRAALDGKASDHFDWQLSYAYGASDASHRTANEVNFLHLAQELGMVACSGPGCSLADFFGANTLTPAQSAYLHYTDTGSNSFTEQSVAVTADMTVDGPPAGPAELLAALDWRDDSYDSHPNPIDLAGDGPNPVNATQAGYATLSGVVQAKIPLLSELPFAKALSVSGAARYDENSSFGRAVTGMEALRWTVSDGWRLWGSHSTGFRAPLLTELYNDKTITVASAPKADPCAPGGADVGNAACQAALAAAGASGATLANVSSLSVLSGGNPLLRPETSQAWAGGGEFSPAFVPGLTATAEYYTVLVRHAIGTLDPGELLASCYGGLAYLVSRSDACQFVGPRRQGTGTLGTIQDLPGNFTDRNTDGIDLTLEWSDESSTLGLPPGVRLKLGGTATYLLSDTLSGGGFSQQQAGTYQGDDALPRWRARLNLDLAIENWEASWTTRYYGGVRNLNPTSACIYSSVPCPAKGAFDFEGNEAGGVFYHDLSLNGVWGDLRVTVGVANLLDRDPPFLAPATQATSLANAGYDFTGRFVYMKADLRF